MKFNVYIYTLARRTARWAISKRRLCRIYIHTHRGEGPMCIAISQWWPVPLSRELIGKVARIGRGGAAPPSREP